jgi:hypothetical protein
MTIKQRDEYNVKVREWNDKRRDAADDKLEKAL